MCTYFLQRFSGKQTLFTEYQSLLSFSSESPLGILAEFVFLYVCLIFLFEASISSSITLQDSVKWFHPLLDRDFYSFPSWLCNFINICGKKQEWTPVAFPSFFYLIFFLRFCFSLLCWQVIKIIHASCSKQSFNDILFISSSPTCVAHYGSTKAKTDKGELMGR